MGCGEFLVKYILFFANLFFALSGLALLALGVVVQLQVSEVVSIAGLNIQVAPIFTMILGGVVFLIAFFGCCGAIRESNCMLVTFSIFMLILMAAKIALATLIFVRLDDVVQDVPRWLQASFTANQDSFHEIEKAFSCCGPTGPLAYRDIMLPNSCCAEPPCTVLSAYPGCDTVVKDFFNTFGIVIGVVAIVIVALELVAAVFGLCLANHVRNKYRRRAY